MGQTQRDKPTQPAIVRAEELLDRIGQRLGYFTALATQRIQRATTSLREQADRLDQPDPASREQSNEAAGARTEEARRLAIAKAEEMVDRMGQRLGRFTSLADLQIQRAVARAYEEAEDMWVKAQNKRKLQ